MATVWRSLPCSRRQLQLDTVLQCGQSFRWCENNAGEWLGVVANRVWRLKQDETHVYYQVYGTCADNSSYKDLSACDIKLEKTLEVKADQQTDGPTHDNQSQTAASSDPGLSDSRQKCMPASSKCLIENGLVKKEDLEYHQVVLSRKCKPTREGRKKMFDVKPEMKETEDSVHLVSILRDYFQLDIDIEQLYHHWSKADPYFRKVAADFSGIRILRQEPIENLFSFICSSNNNIARISGMVDKLCSTYGKPVAEVDGKMYHSFPTVSSLAQDGIEDKLRQLGFGYRAKFISKSACYIMDNGGDSWLWALRHQPYEKAKAELMKLHGVGAKVADCVCLMSLDKTGAIPVDTHVWQFAARHYLPKLQGSKSVTDKLYQEIGDHFRGLWGSYAGWAQSVLFTSELRHMQGKKSLPDLEPKRKTSSSKKRQPIGDNENLLNPKCSKSSKARKT